MKITKLAPPLNNQSCVAFWLKRLNVGFTTEQLRCTLNYMTLIQTQAPCHLPQPLVLGVGKSASCSFRLPLNCLEWAPASAFQSQSHTAWLLIPDEAMLPCDAASKALWEGAPSTPKGQTAAPPGGKLKSTNTIVINLPDKLDLISTWTKQTTKITPY